MASRREQVLDAVKALIAAALPNADVVRNAANNAKPKRIAPGGLVIIHDGDPGEPEVDLSPLSYTYSHRIPLEIVAYESATKTAGQVIDEMLGAVGTAVEADRSLGGLCNWLEPEAPETDDLTAPGADIAGSAEAALLADYTTANPFS